MKLFQIQKRIINLDLIAYVDVGLYSHETGFVFKIHLAGGEVLPVYGNAKSELQLILNNLCNALFAYEEESKPKEPEKPEEPEDWRSYR